MSAKSSARDRSIKRVHPLAWAWEPLLIEPTCLVRPMFGGKAVYLRGLLHFYIVAKQEPWNGLCVCTDRAQHDSLRKDMPALAPHPVLPKWLYLSCDNDDFESQVNVLHRWARQGDPRLGVPPSARQQSSAPASAKAKRVRAKSIQRP